MKRDDHHILRGMIEKAKGELIKITHGWESKANQGGSFELDLHHDMQVMYNKIINLCIFGEDGSSIMIP